MDWSPLASEEPLRKDFAAVVRDLVPLFTVLFMGFRVLRILGFEDGNLGNLWCLNLFVLIVLMYYD